MELVDSSSASTSTCASASPAKSASSASSVDVAAAALPLDELGACIVDLSGRLAATTCRWLLLVADFDARQGYLVFGLASTAQWLSHACGIAHRTAVEHVRVAGSLRTYPRLAQEMGAGRLSFSQVRAISRIDRPGAGDDTPSGPDEPGLVEDLIGVARHATVAQLEVVIRGLRTVDHNEQATDPGEYLKQSWTSDSRWQLSARLDPERGAVVGAALGAIMARDGCTPAQALERLADIALATLADTPNPPRNLRGHERAAVLIHLDAADIPPQPAKPDPNQAPVPRSAERGTGHVSTVARPYARIAGRPGLPDRVVQRLLCEGRIRTVIHDGPTRDGTTNVLDVGRSHRLVTDRQYRALLLRHHNHCAHPGCPTTTNLHAHHRIHWIHGGRTDLHNLLLLCERHHLAHHNGGFHIHTLGAGRFRFVTTDGRDLSAPLRNPGGDDTRPLEAEHAHLAADAATPRWDGQRLDRPYAISVLAQRRQIAS